MRFKRSRALLLVMALVATTAACGSRLSDEERAQAISSNAGGGSGVAQGGDSVADVVATASTTAFELAITGEPTGGDFTLAVEVDDTDEETEPIAFDADGEVIAAALHALDVVDEDDIDVTGSGPFEITLSGALADAAVSVAASELTGGDDPQVVVTEIVPEVPTGGDVAAPTDGGVSTGDTGGDVGAEGPAGPATPGQPGGGEGPAACRPGTATGPGVSPTEITVGNVSQLSGLVPGFGQTGVNGAKAYFNMINNQGGVCGRTIKLVGADDRFQAATNRAETQKMADKVIALVGNTSVVDDGGAPVIDAEGFADVSLATTKPRAAAQNNFSPNPIDPTPNVGNGLAGILAYLKATYGIKKPAIFYQDVATGVNQSNSYKIDFQNAGIPVSNDNVYPVAATATNFNTQANHMKQSKVDFVITVAEVNAMANLAKAFKNVGYFPKVPFYGAQVYGKKFLQLAGDAAEGTIVGLIFAIPEEASNNPAMQAFTTWYARTAPGADVDFFALAGWVAADMFVTALRGAGPDPTQAKIIGELKKMKSYNGNGLVANINPAEKKAPTCFHIVEVKGGKWVKSFPDKGFKC